MNTKQPFEDQQLNQSKASISSGEMYSILDKDRNIFPIDHDGKSVTYISVHYGSLLHRIEDFVETVISTDALAFEITEDPIKISKLKPLCFFYDTFNSMRNSYVEGYDYSPYVNTFFLACKALELWNHELPKNPYVYYSERKSTAAKIFNELIAWVRKEGRSKRFKNQVYARSYNAIRNYQEAEEYIACLFDWHSRLLVIRIDIGYRHDYAEKLSIPEANKDFVRLFNNLRFNKLFDALVGKLWKLEVGEEKGIHYHLMLFFDGAAVRKDAFIASQIGEYWVKKITGGNGVYYNCNASKNKYKRCGIGMISHNDHEKRQNLLNALQYLTKQDQYLRCKPGQKTRSFGKGNMPSERTSGVGRPRRSK